jgi:DNA-binding transcriptional LysR family regulator
VKWDDLAFVLAAAKEGSYVAAGKRLQVANTTVSRRIATLEEELGTALFVRNAQRLEPTPAANALLALADRFDAELSDVGARISGEDQRLAGVVSVSTVDLLAEFLLPAVARFSRQHPSLEISISVGYERARLARREADIALRATERPPEELFGRKLVRIGYGLYAPPTWEDRSGGVRDLALLDRRLEARSSERWLIERFPNARVACRVDRNTTLVHAVNAGVGCAVLSRYFARRAGLFELEVLGDEMSADIWLLTHPGLKRAARVRAVMDLVADEIQAHEDELAGA